MTQVKIQKYWMRRKKQLREACTPNPNEDTLSIWALDDQKDAMKLEMFERMEAEENAKRASETPSYNVKINSNVRIKR